MLLGHMTVTASTIIQRGDRTVFQVNEAWLDEWPIKNFFGGYHPVPPGCSVTKTVDGTLFRGEIDDGDPS